MTPSPSDRFAIAVARKAAEFDASDEQLSELLTQTIGTRSTTSQELVATVIDLRAPGDEDGTRRRLPEFNFTVFLSQIPGVAYSIAQLGNASALELGAALLAGISGALFGLERKHFDTPETVAIWALYTANEREKWGVHHVNFLLQCAQEVCEEYDVPSLTLEELDRALRRLATAKCAEDCGNQLWRLSEKIGL